jgi:protoporphyrinogen oxidase
LKKQTPYIAKNQKAQDFIDSMSKHKMYSFSGGLQTFSDCLYEKIKQLNVQVIQDSIELFLVKVL